MTSIDQIVKGIYRISTFDERIGLSFNQYLIQDQKTVLVHTGSSLLFDEIVHAIRQVTDPAQIAYAFISHFEADECGALARFRAVAKQLVPVGSAVTARQLAGFGIADNTLVQKEGELLSLGQRRLGFIAYPSEMHLWEGLLAYEQTEQMLFTADLFIRRGPTPAPLVSAPAGEVLDIPPAAIPWDEARATCLAKIKALHPHFLALGHGPVLAISAAESSHS